MSKFWAEDEKDSSSSDSSSDSEEYDSGEVSTSSSDESSGESGEEKVVERGAIHRFDDWDSSEEEKRRVKTQAEKLEDGLMESRNALRDIRDTGEDLKNVPEAHDTSTWPLVVDYSALREEVASGLGLLAKYKREVKKNGVPGYYIKILADVVQATATVQRAAKEDPVFKEAISTSNWKALTRICQWLDKEVSKRFAVELKEHSADPLAARWADPEHKEEILEEVEEAGKGGPKRGTREFWVKVEGVSSEDSDEDSYEGGGKKSKGRKRRQRAKKEQDVPSDEEGEGESEVAVAVREEERDDLEPEDVDRLIKEISESRTKRATDFTVIANRLTTLLPKCTTAVQRLRCRYSIITARFEAIKTLPADEWRAVRVQMAEFLDLLRATKSVPLVAVDPASVDPEDITEEQKALLESKKYVTGSLLSHLEPLDAMLMRSLRSIDPHTQEYLTRLQDDRDFVKLAELSYDYYRNQLQDLKKSASTLVLLMQHLYYKPFGEDGKRQDLTERLNGYATFIYENGDVRERTHALLMCVYHMALQDKFELACERLLMSHLQETAHQMDIPTQILFNRCNVQIGLCAFRLGLVKQAHACLSEVYAGGRIKELLAQGTSSQRYVDKDRELERIERERMLPYHMHINAELLESAHLVSALLLEVPNLAQHGKTGGRVISKYLRKLLDYFERQIFTGPPETTRDFIASSSRALSRGNWRKASALLLAMPGWEHLEDRERVMERLQAAIKHSALTTYLFTYAPHYDTLALSELATLFEIEERAIHRAVSKLMIEGDLPASWNQPASVIVFHRIEPSALQKKCLQHTSKLASYVEANERLLDQHKSKH